MSSDQSKGPAVKADATHADHDVSAPILPHERDQTGGIAEVEGVQPGARDIIKKAHDDIQNGQEDTDMHDQRTLEGSADK